MLVNDCKIEVDAGETINVSRNVLNHVEKEVMQRIRPSKFRRILQIDTSIPWWVEGAEYDMVTSSAEWIAAEDGSADFATASSQVSKEGLSIVEFMSGYRYRNRELVRAQKMGMRVDSARMKAVMDKAETVLDHIAANGTINGSKTVAQIGTGLYNQTSVTPFTDPSVVSTAYEDLAFGTTDQQNAMVEAVVDDALQIERKAEIDTKEAGGVDTIVYPLSFATFMTRTKPYTELSIEKAILKRARYIKRIEYWAKGETLGAGGLRRIVALNSRDKDAARFILSQAPTPGRSFVNMQGVSTPVTMVCGGFNTKDPASLVYVDAAAAS